MQLNEVKKQNETEPQEGERNRNLLRFKLQNETEETRMVRNKFKRGLKSQNETKQTRTGRNMTEPMKKGEIDQNRKERD